MYKTFAPSEFNFLSPNGYLTQFNKLYDAICEYNYEDENPNFTARKILGGYDLFKQQNSDSLRFIWEKKLNSWRRTQTKGWNAVVQHKNNEDKYGRSHMKKLKKIVTFLKRVAEEDPSLKNKWKVISFATAYESLSMINEAMLNKKSKYEMLVFVKDYYGEQDGVKKCAKKDYCEKREYLESTFDAYRKAKHSTREYKYVKEDFRFKLKEK
tara:strand:- start:1921 stop:2553 length:633 start_codon:yes stop_codon:yes gene_type:complete